MILEIVLFSPILADTSLMLYAQGKTYFRIPRQVMRFALLAAYTADMIWAYSTPSWWFRTAKYLRCALVALYAHRMRRDLQIIIRTLPDVAYIFALGACFIIFYAWMGVLVFPRDSPEGRATFPSFKSGMWNLLILITTANFPDVMMPGYAENRFTFLFFLAFIGLGVFFLINMVTAVVYNTYGQIGSENEKAKGVFWEENVKRAFDLLRSVSEQSGAEVSVPAMKNLLNELNNYKDIPFISQKHADKLLTTLDADQNGVIDFAEFRNLTHVMTMNFKNVYPLPWLERRFPRLQKNAPWKKLKHVVLHRYFDTAVDVVLAISIGLTVYETWSALQGHAERIIDSQLASSKSWELYINFFFVAEMILKISTLGFEAYWKRVKNQFDFLCTVFTAFVTLYVYLPTKVNSPVFIRYAAILRLGRLLRLLLGIPRFQVIADSFVRLLPEAGAAVKVLFCAMYMFSVLGCQIFGGRINTDPQSPYSKMLAKTDFASAGYWANNFNDMPSGMVALFELLVVNNWFEIVDGFTATCGPWAAAYFIIWYVFGVLIFLNIVVAIILDSFQNAFQDNLKMKTS